MSERRIICIKFLKDLKTISSGFSAATRRIFFEKNVASQQVATKECFFVKTKHIVFATSKPVGSWTTATHFLPKHDRLCVQLIASATEQKNFSDVADWIIAALAVLTLGLLVGGVI